MLTAGTPAAPVTPEVPVVPEAPEEAPEITEIEETEPTPPPSVVEPETEVTEDITPAEDDDLEARLARLKDLRDQGLINDELYEQRAAELLDEL